MDQQVWDILFGGVTPEMKCVNYLSPLRNQIDLCLIFALTISLIATSVSKGRQSSTKKIITRKINNSNRLMLLSLLATSFSREIWLKIQQKDLITVLMHCYTMAIFQIGSLVMMPYRRCQAWINWLTRAYMPHMIFALGAMVMPDFHARSHPVDIINFYLNHILVLCIPIYILSHFNIEVHVFDLNHLLVTLSTFLSLSLVSVTAAFAAKTNINFSMCPGAVDKLWPFGGHLWRFKCILAFITIWFPLVNICVKTTLLKMI